MASSFEDFIQSQQFTFFVGQEAKPIVVHASAIAATSPQLNALVNGGMKESEKRCAKIEDVQVDDFVRFCEYAYRGDYTVPPCELLPPEPCPIISENHRREDFSWDLSTLLPTDKVGRKKKKAKSTISGSILFSEPARENAEESLVYDKLPPVEDKLESIPVSRTPFRAQFHSRTYLIDSDPKAQILQNFEPKSNNTAHENFTPVFLAHARLYWFAHLRLIAPLKVLTLRKLHSTLTSFKLYEKRVGDVIELSRYAYSNQDLPGRSDDGTLDDLRKLVVEYIVCEIDTIGKNHEFMKYIEEGGEFVGDFWRVAREYMC